MIVVAGAILVLVIVVVVGVIVAKGGQVAGSRDGDPLGGVPLPSPCVWSSLDTNDPPACS